MSWSPAKPLENKREVRPVRVGAAQKSVRYRARLVVVLLPTHLPGAEFLAPGARVMVLLGGGEHAGMLRIQPDGPVRVAATGGKHGRSGAVILRIALPAGVGAAKHAPEAVEFDHGDGWVELTLPQWARPTVLPARTAEAGAAPQRTPYSLSARVPDPAAELRGRSGR